MLQRGREIELGEYLAFTLPQLAYLLGQSCIVHHHTRKIASAWGMLPLDALSVYTFSSPKLYRKGTYPKMLSQISRI